MSAVLQKGFAMKRLRWIAGLCLSLALVFAACFFLRQAKAEKDEVKAPETKYYSGEAIAGAVLQILDRNGRVIKEWETTKAAYEIGAELTAGETYILHEKSAPPGYLLAEDIEFTVPTDGIKKEITMVDAPTSVEIEKKDKDTNQPVYNAILQVLDEEKVVVDEWTTDGTIHEIKGVLVAGKKYTIHEKKTPVGYKQSDDVTFTAPEVEAPYKVTFYNVQVVDDIPQTGDKLPMALLFGIGALAVAGAVGVYWIRKKMQ